MDVQALGQPGEDLELRRRQRRDAEEAEPGGEPERFGRHTVERGQETRLHPHPVDAPDRPDQLAPEGRVPGLPAPPLPVQDPVRPVDQILVEQVGDPRGELMAAEVVLGIREIGAERGEDLSAGDGGEQSHQTPDQDLPIVGGVVRHVEEDPAEELPDQAGGEGEVDVGGDAEAVRQPHPEPAGHPVALDRDGLGRERRSEGDAQDLGQVVRQPLQAVTLMEDQHPAHPRAIRTVPSRMLTKLVFTQAAQKVQPQGGRPSSGRTSGTSQRRASASNAADGPFQRPAR